ncbi:DNA-formamidopyrimidine glycosylase family protein [uncultured Chitinophaga sp.]|uniref:DNA-formamidopyrimidine glycosylase family protein n=1 Tax=uncultured Chitinophaga sp. TaxID=339340 RepID=UPI0025D69B5E|nr:DNA-formamidopyrimidine glycosylase family protein [uncultured Chitinophaga sp.]
MPEGPSIVILKELAAPFAGKKVLEVSGDAPIDLERLAGQKIIAFKTWGKHLLICFKQFTVRIHLMLFGSYSINEQTKPRVRLGLTFAKGELFFYACLVKIIDEPLSEVYDWSADVMNQAWDRRKARAKLKQEGDRMICDVLLDQNIFAGSGNIIKNEVLFRSRIQPESLVSAIPPKKITALLTEVVKYSFEFLHWKKENTLKKHWQAHTKKICPRCDIPFVKKYTGKNKRRSFFCTNCQELYE